MADDDRADARDDTRDAQVASWLEVEPLDEVTRRRLVGNALRELDDAPAAATAPTRSSHAWQWLTAAAAVVVVLVVGLALLTAGGGNDEQQATQGDRATSAPKAAAGPTREVGDFGNLDDPANLAALRSALGDPAASAESLAPLDANDAAGSQRGTTSEAAPTSGDAALQVCGVVTPDGGSIVAQGRGTIAGRRATVVLLEAADGTRTLEAVLESPCEVRELP